MNYRDFMNVIEGVQEDYMPVGYDQMYGPHQGHEAYNRDVYSDPQAHLPRAYPEVEYIPQDHGHDVYSITNAYGNTYDDEFYNYYSDEKKRQAYMPEAVKQVDEWTSYDKIQDPTQIYNYFAPMHDVKAHVADTKGRDHVYNFQTTEMIFMQEEYEHHIRIKSHLVVALEALKDATYFLDRKQASIERQIYINAQNIESHQ